MFKDIAPDDKSIKELDYVEAALLAALPKAPSKYNPYKNKKPVSYTHLTLPTKRIV